MKNVTIDCGLPPSELNLDMVAEMLMDLGAMTVSVEDAAKGTDEEDPKYAEPAPGQVEWEGIAQEDPGKKYWKKSVISAMFDDSENIEQVIMQIGVQFHLRDEPRYKEEVVGDEDWVVKVQTSFKPVQIGRAWVVFPWHKPPEPNALNVLMTPGMAFGTGEHWTTKLCGEWVLKTVKGGESVLDYGSGSGILSILAAMAGATNVVGVEIDPDAVESSKANALTNRVNDRVQFYGPNKDPPGVCYDIVVANILCEPLKILAPVIAARSRKGTRLAMSGVLVSQAQDVCERYKEVGFSMTNSAVDAEWSLLEGEKLK